MWFQAMSQLNDLLIIVSGSLNHFVSEVLCDAGQGNRVTGDQVLGTVARTPSRRPSCEGGEFR